MSRLSASWPKCADGGLERSADLHALTKSGNIISVRISAPGGVVLRLTRKKVLTSCSRIFTTATAGSVPFQVNAKIKNYEHPTRAIQSRNGSSSEIVASMRMFTLVSQLFEQNWQHSQPF